MYHRWLVVLLFCLMYAQTHAQTNKFEKERTRRHHSQTDWEDVGREIGEAFRALGQRLETDVKVTADQVEETLNDPELWENVEQEIAHAGCEATDATRQVSRELSVHSNKNISFERGHFQDEKTKKFSKSFRLSSGEQLAIENKFGKVHINTWDKPEATVEVVMTARSSSDSKAQSLLDRINIVVSENSAEHEIMIKTQLDNMSNWGNGKQSFEINYTVNMPRNNPLRIKNSFGDTYVADCNGKADIQCSYGSLKTERLNHTDNYVKVSFGNGRIGYCKSGDIKVSYSDLEVTDGGNLVIESSFSELQIGNLQTTKIKAKYGSVDVGTNGKGFKSFDIDGSFSDIDLRIPATMGFDFDIKVSYADLDWDDSEVHYKSVEKSGNSKTCIGSFGKSSAGNIRVSSRYGDVDFKVRN